MLPAETYYPENLKAQIADFKFYSFEAQSQQNLLLPLGKVQIIFHLKGGTEHQTNFSGGWQQRPAAFIAGPFDASYRLLASQDTEIFAVQLKPGMSRYFLPEGSQWRNQLIGPDDYWGASGRQLAEQVHQAKSNAERAQIVEQFLQKNFRPLGTSPVENATHSILKSQGIGTISKWSEEAGLSISHFRRRFVAEVGLSPKRFQKITRINALVEYFRRHPAITLTDLAYQFAYFDQAHFIKDFRSVTGLAPRQFFAR